ncbi:MAG TPA: MOSC domain-containing protein [Pyrinomonadaceae bacterium]|jgi:MOSC domain-containing protein YiiM|nr:MOSC domain-containing protein [Pyrinomonadaceae bacterium]
MKVISVNVGLPKLVKVSEEDAVLTGIFKEPVEGKVRVNELNLAGDAQADLTVHGGPYKSVYAYTVEHYDLWRAELPEMELPLGMFGENLTVTDMPENEVFIGDHLRIGTAEFAVTQPRMPCYKLGIRFGPTGPRDILRRFLKSRRSGFYLTVLKTGELQTGDRVEVFKRDENRVTVEDIVRIYITDKKDVDTMRRALKLEYLPGHWKDEFKQRLES